MAKAKSRTKSKLQPTANAGKQSTKWKSKFTLNAEHKRFLDEHADKHAVSPPEEKPEILKHATEELLHKYSITRKEDIAKAKKVIWTMLLLSVYVST